MGNYGRWWELATIPSTTSLTGITMATLRCLWTGYLEPSERLLWKTMNPRRATDVWDDAAFDRFSQIYFTRFSKLVSGAVWVLGYVFSVFSCRLFCGVDFMLFQLQRLVLGRGTKRKGLEVLALASFLFFCLLVSCYFHHLHIWCNVSPTLDVVSAIMCCHKVGYRKFGNLDLIWSYSDG